MEARQDQLRLDRFVWDTKFNTRQIETYSALDATYAEPDKSTIHDFVRAQRFSLVPPQYNDIALQEFLEKATLEDLTGANPSPVSAEPIALIDDRCDSSGWQDANGIHHSARDWNGYSKHPPHGTSIYTKILSARELYERLRMRVCMVDGWRNQRC